MHVDATFLAFVALVIFFAILGRLGIHKQITKSLDDRAAGIAKELAEAHRLRAEAERLLASYEAKRIEAEAEAAATLAQAHKDAEAMTAEARKSLEDALRRRMKQAEERIARAEAQALADIRGATTDAAVNAASKLLSQKLDAGAQSRLVESGIAELGKTLR
jgi:F-type H+-transporting ATPase subunit b